MKRYALIVFHFAAAVLGVDLAIHSDEPHVMIAGVLLLVDSTALFWDAKGDRDTLGP